MLYYNVALHYYVALKILYEHRGITLIGFVRLSEINYLTSYNLTSGQAISPVAPHWVDTDYVGL